MNQCCRNTVQAAGRLVAQPIGASTQYYLVVTTTLSITCPCGRTMHLRIGAAQ